VRPKRPPHPVLTKYYTRDADRHRFVVTLFDGAARHYDRLCRVALFGGGGRYRRDALQRAGLVRGMRLLDAATGTGLVARAALEILGDRGAVVGLDPSRGMLAVARQSLAIPLVQGRVEELPFERDHFDVLSLGYALRHVADLEEAFLECGRVLKPGGRLLLLEMSRPRSRAAAWLVRTYFQTVLPRAARLLTGSTPAALLMEYYWDTIAECAPPAVVLEALDRGGFVDARRRVLWGVLTEYQATKPGR
jgi:demethylmenaquinone methyltransferase / 2-methoxy-6-polyprenyl-1,4-benzoquinol methylase